MVRATILQPLSDPCAGCDGDGHPIRWKGSSVGLPFSDSGFYRPGADIPSPRGAAFGGVSAEGSQLSSQKNHGCRGVMTTLFWALSPNPTSSPGNLAKHPQQIATPELINALLGISAPQHRIGNHGQIANIPHPPRQRRSPIK